MPTQSNVYCTCGTFMRVSCNGVTVEETLEDGAPYKLWRADLYVCPACKSSVVVGFAHKPIAEHFQSEYTLIRDEAMEAGTYIIPRTS
jgi:hypothetical protein